MVAGSSSPYDVSFSYFYTELILYSKDVKFVSVPQVFVCVSHHMRQSQTVRKRARREAASTPRSQTV
jgi:hypothetical protein